MRVSNAVPSELSFLGCSTGLQCDRSEEKISHDLKQRLMINTAMGKKRPPHILVTGAHRSGTTWVGRTIDFHDSITYISEPFNVTYPKPEMNLALRNWFTHAPTSEDLDEITSAFDNLLNPSIFNVANQILSSSKNSYQTKKKLFKRMLSYYLKKPRFLIKDPIAIFSAGWLYQRYNLKVVCLIRNPFGFVGSLKKANWNYFFFRSS